MRISSIIVFAAFAFLTSAYPIDGHSQEGGNSLWKRVGGHPGQQAGSSHEVREYSYDGTVIKNHLQSGEIQWAHVDLRNGESYDFLPSERPHPPSGQYRVSRTHSNRKVKLAAGYRAHFQYPLFACSKFSWAGWTTNSDIGGEQ